MTPSSGPVTELGTPALGVLGAGWNLPAWSYWADEQEYVPELVWPQSVRLYDRMRADTQLDALYAGCTLPIRRYRWLLDSNGAPARMVSQLSSDLNLDIKGQQPKHRGRYKRRFVHDNHLRHALLALIYGHMYFEQVGEIGADGKWHPRKLSPRMPHTIQQIKVAHDGGLVSITQPGTTTGAYTAGFTEREIPVDQLVAYIWDQEGANWAGRSMFRSCYKNWLIKDRLLRVDAINHDRAGGTPAIEAPPGATAEEIAALAQFAQQFRVGEKSGGALPAGSKLQMVSSQGSDVVNSIRYHDESMARRFLMMFIQLGQTQTGSRALGKTFVEFFTQSQEATANWYVDNFNEHVIEDWVDWNYGENVDHCPLLTYEYDKEPHFAVADLVALIESGAVLMDDDLEEVIREEVGLPDRNYSQPTRPVPGNPPLVRPQTEVPASGGAVAAGASVRAAAAQQVAPFLPPRRPHVMAAAQPALVTIPNVEIASVGMEYPASTGPFTATADMLRDAVTAANNDPNVCKSPRLKLGHIDPRFNLPEFDGQPSFGVATNLRYDEDVMKVFGDYVGVPQWLARIMPAAYPSRSLEGDFDVTTVSGKQWKFCLSAVSLLGVSLPAIGNLEDLPQLYGTDMPQEVQLSQDIKNIMQMYTASDTSVSATAVRAAIDVDTVRREFYTQVTEESPDRYWWWVRAMLLGDGEDYLIADDDDGQLYKITFSVGSDDQVSFGEPTPVKINYVEQTTSSDKKAAASFVVAGMAQVAASATVYESRESSRLNATPEGGILDPLKIRRDLGLEETATDEEVSAKLQSLMASGAGAPAPASTEATQPDPELPGQPANPNPGEQPDVAVRPATAEPSTEPLPGTPATAQDRELVAAAAGTVTVDAATWEETRKNAALAAEHERERINRNHSDILDNAVRAGKIPPARRDHYQVMLQADPDGTTQLLNSLASGLIPVHERGSGINDANTMMDGNQGGLPSEWFPEIAERQRVAAAAAAGTGHVTNAAKQEV